MKDDSLGASLKSIVSRRIITLKGYIVSVLLGKQYQKVQEWVV